MGPWLSIVIPVLDEAQRLPGLLISLQGWRQRGVEVLVVDGGSSDHSQALAAPLVDQLLVTAPGRATQMNAAAAEAGAPLLWFLHADSLIDDRHLQALARLPGGRLWGRFDVRLSGSGPGLAVVARAMNLRSRLTGIATGDQGIFVSGELFRQVGGYPQQPLMEDIALSAALRSRVRPRCLTPPMVADSRRWRERGVFRTIVQMWWLRFRYWRGEDPARLHREYYRS